MAVTKLGYTRLMPLWIAFTLLAICMQSFRTAAQKQLAGHLSVAATTLVRYLFGLPFAALYFLLLFSNASEADPALAPGLRFLVSASLAGIAQIAATFLLIKTLMIRNFAVGTALAKTQALLAAILGSVFFNEALGAMGYLSVILGVAGVLVASNWKVSVQDLTDNKALRFGLGAGLCFALTSLFARDASMGLEGPRVLAASAVLLYSVTLQTLVCLIWVGLTERADLAKMLANWRACWFIGFTSLAGSIGWFTANSLQNPALVNTLGQGEFVVTILITVFYFREKISRREALGMLLIVASLLVLIQLP